MLITRNTLKTEFDQSVLPFVTKPARYLGNELNVIHKDISASDVHFAIAFPEVYELAMSSQATNILYHLLNREAFIYAERVFAPWFDMEELLRQHQLPLVSLESFTPLRAFDIIGFTLQYELTYTNILNMLDLGGIPMFSGDRQQDDPIVIAGGPCSCNPEPLAAFIDAFYIGDAEEGLVGFCDVYRDQKKQNRSRAEILRSLAQISGVYVPALYQAVNVPGTAFEKIEPESPEIPARIKNRIIPVLKEEYYPEKPLVPLIEVTHDRLAIETMRGCTEGCRYCNAGMIYRPTRERTVDDIVDYTLKTLPNTGYDEVSFLSLSISDYSALAELMKKEHEALKDDQVNVSFPSMRLDSFNEDIAEFARSVRKSGFTFAPEAGSARLRKVINKNISNEDLLKAVEIAVRNGWKTLKFYFMIGLPTETKEDIESIAVLMERSVALSKKYGRVQFHVSVSPFSPKSHTPFQWERQNTKEEFQQKTDLLRNRLSRIRQIKLSWRDPDVSKIECMLGRGDRKLAQVIYAAWKAGAKFDGWSDRFDFQTWENAFISQGIDMTVYTGELETDHPLPWDHIDKGVVKNYLLRERKNAYDEKITIDCKEGTCFGCGIQRKSGFRDVAECYTHLQLHDHKKTTKSAKKKLNPIKPEKTGRQPVNLTFRLHFEKSGDARFLGHLDLLRVFERACRRAGIRMVHSEGFNPRPKFSFGPALSLGYSSLAEYVDMSIASAPAGDPALLINPHLPSGIKIIQVREIPSHLQSLSACINRAEYEVDLNGRKVSEEKINDLLAKKELMISRRSKGKEKSLNIRPYINNIKRVNGSLILETETIDGRTARVDEILSLLINDPLKAKALPVRRNKQLIKSGSDINTPMEF